MTRSSGPETSVARTAVLVERRPEMFRRVRFDTATSGSIARRGVLSVIATLVQGAARFATNVLIGRIGGPVVLGTTASANSTAQFFSLLWPTTTGAAASKYVAFARGQGAPEQADAVAALLARRTVQASLLLAALSVPVWVLLESGGLVESGVVAALLIGYSGHSYTQGLQFGAGQVQRAASWETLCAVLGLAGVFGLLLAGVDGLAVLLPLAGSQILYSLAGWPRRCHGTIDRKLRREIDAFVALGVFGTLASAGFLQLSLMVVRISDGAASAGQYAAALNLATPASVVTASLSSVLFPSMAEAWGRGDLDGLRRQTDVATRALIAIMTTVFGTIALCSHSVARLVWGPRYEVAASLLPLLALAVLATAIGVACTNALTSRSHRGMVESTVSSLAGMAVGALAWAVLAPGWGAHGVAVGYLCGTTMIGATPIAIVWRRDRHRWGGVAGRFAAGVALLGLLLAAERTFRLPVGFEPVVGLGFAAVWLTLVRNDLAGFLALVGRSRGGRPAAA